MNATNIHATGLVLMGFGLVLQGPSGAGKSLLALELLHWAALGGWEGALVSDDRLDVMLDGSGLAMRAPAGAQGQMELRHRGIIALPHRASAGVDLLVDFVEGLARMPEDHEFIGNLLGCSLARCPVPRGPAAGLAHQRLLILEALRPLAEQQAKEKRT